MFGRTILVAAALVATAACTSKAPDTSADEAQLRADAPVWWDHYNKGDADGVANLYAEDGVIQAPGIPAVVGRAKIREYIAGDIANTKAAGLTFQGGEITGVGAAGDQGWVSGTFTVTDAAGATVESGKYLSVYRRTPEGWKLIRDTWNSDAAPAPAASTAAPPTTPGT